MNLKIALIVLSTFAAAPVAFAATSEASPTALAAAPENKSEKARLQKRFEARYPDLARAKAEGRVGETSEGFVDAVTSADSATQKLIDDENADRRALYKLIAEEEGVDSSVVAQRAAQRNFKKARKGESLKDGSTWKKKS